MKRITITTLLLILAVTTYSQKNNPYPALTKQDYLTKSKKQKTAARLLLSGGVVMSTIGTGLAIDDATAATSDAIVTIFSLGTVEPVNDDKDNTVVANVLFFGGLAAMLGSIPLFKAAKKITEKE